MAGFNGNKFVLKVANGDHTVTAGAANLTFVQVAALRGTSYTWTNGVVDASTKDNAGWNEVVEGGGIKQVSITADGVWTTKALTDTTVAGEARNAGGRLMQMVESDKFWNAQIVDEGAVGGAKTLQGKFFVENFSRTGEVNGLDTFSITLTSTDAVVITPTIVPQV